MASSKLLSPQAAAALIPDQSVVSVSSSSGLDCPERMLQAIVDPMLIRVAVGNLISNALKYSAGPIALILGAHAEAGTIEIRVADQGPGIPPEEREAIFERYYRSSSHAALPGAGLGLFIVRQVAGLHGGTVRVEDGQAGGSTFIITLPDRLKTDAA